MEQQSDHAHPDCGMQEKQDCRETIQKLAEVDDVGVQQNVELEEQVPAGEDLKKQQEACVRETLDNEQKLGTVEPALKELEAPEALNDLGSEDQAKVETLTPDAKPEEFPPVAGGWLAFPFLQEAQTKAVLRESRTLVILRGLPGSGKTFLANAIKKAYDGVSSVVSADDHNVRLENYSSADGHKALDEAIHLQCSTGTAVVVVDDTNHTHERIARLGELAELHLYCTLFLEPLTEWSKDPERLVQKSKWGLNKDQMQALTVKLEETSIPLFFAWFLEWKVQECLKTMVADLVKTLAALETFKKHISDFTGEAVTETNLEEYFNHKGLFHCTTKFCDYGKAEGAKEYAEMQCVKESYSRVSELVLSSLFVTSRTVGARVSLSEEQLCLWPSDEVRSVPGMPCGSHAHITLGCAEGVEPRQTGLDLLDLDNLQQDGQTGELVQDQKLGALTYYGVGMWVLSLHEPIRAAACFSSYYGYRENEKEAEKRKKKPKCTLY